MINSFLHVLTSMEQSFYSVSQAQRRLFLKVNHFVNFGKIKNYLQSRVSSSHVTLTTVAGFLVVLTIRRQEISVLDALVADTNCFDNSKSLPS